jgi:primase-polymerase (primpol)-like protein
VKGRRASVADSRDWAPFEVALNQWWRYPGGYSGLGFVFSKSDPFAGIDLDDSLDAGEPKQWARGMIERFSDTYTEISPSGRGLKIWVRGALPKTFLGRR